jgi:double-stranded uracil-DNA glycosylase
MPRPFACDNVRHMRKLGLDPVTDMHTEILIMGALPSDVSRLKAQYYADTRNDFWKLMEAVLDEPLMNLPYEARIQTLLGHRIALWDVYRSCLRPGSMDKDTSDGRLNDFTVLKTRTPKLRLVCFNGREAGRWEEQLRALGYRTMVLPSSSGANRTDQGNRLRVWKKIVRESIFDTCKKPTARLNFPMS